MAMATQPRAHGRDEAPASGAVDLTELFREPQQERSRKTLARLVDATHRLLEEEGPTALTVTGVARAAGTSVGSFYARFDGKEELIRYVGESALAQALAAWSDAVAACRGTNSPGDTDDPSGNLGPELASLADHLLETLRSGPAARVESMDGLQDPAPTRLQRMRTRLVQDLEEVLESTGSSIHARWLAARGLVAMTRSVAEEGGGDGPGELAREISAMLALYLADRKGRPEADTPDGPDEAASAGPEEAAPDEPDEATPGRPDEEAGGDPVDPFDVWG